jgi:predicted ATP-dependent endonuclease of OLD family
VKISRIYIENFRSIGRLEAKLPQVCALVGPNNSGKTNILEAIRRVLDRNWGVGKDDFSEEDVRFNNPDGNIVVELDFDPPPVHQPYVKCDDIPVPRLRFDWCRYKIGEDVGERRMATSALDHKGEPVYVPTKAPKKKGQFPSPQPLTKIPKDFLQQIPVVHIAASRRLADQLPTARYSLLRHLMADIDKDFNDPGNRVAHRGEDVPRAQRFMHFIDAAMELMRTPKLLEVEATIRNTALRQLGLDPAVDRDKLDLRFGPFTSHDFYNSLDLMVREGSFEISATQLGGGVQNALVLAIMKAFEEHRKKGAILLIEEPEMFLHPQHQRSLYKTLREIGKDNQVIYTTHSPHFVSIPEYEEVGLVRKSEGGTTITFSSAPSSPQRSEKLRKELDPERNELFFATRLLLVEGDTEKLALPEFAKRLKLDLDSAGATIVEVGGKKSLPELADIAASFKIPVGIIYDQDTKNFEGDEVAFNKALDAREDKVGGVRVWRLVKDYEGELRSTMGEKDYQAACQRHPGHSKAIRQRLIAAEADTPLPPKIREALLWLAGTEDAADA